jgi:hypothetical protein
MAVRGSTARARSVSRATSIIMIAFFLTMPISRMTPMSEIRLNSVPNASSASTAPTPAEGKVDRIVIG